jgi:hypothetical protein
MVQWLKTWLLNVEVRGSSLQSYNLVSVATLVLGSRLKQGLVKVRAKSELESHISHS